MKITRAVRKLGLPRTLVILSLTAIMIPYISCQSAYESAKYADASFSGGSLSDGDPMDSNPPPLPTDPNELFFVESVRPLLQQQCFTCHNQPQFVTGEPGPLTIYEYASMRAKLAMGTTAVDNELILKVSNQIAHTGDNQCPMGVNAGDIVCGKLIEWWEKEFAATP